jgi:hypothetical protein
MNKTTTNQGGQKVKAEKSVYLKLKVARANYDASLANFQGLSSDVDKNIFETTKWHLEYNYKSFLKALDALRNYQEKYGCNA